MTPVPTSKGKSNHNILSCELLLSKYSGYYRKIKVLVWTASGGKQVCCRSWSNARVTVSSSSRAVRSTRWPAAENAGFQERKKARTTHHEGLCNPWLSSSDTIPRLPSTVLPRPFFDSRRKSHQERELCEPYVMISSWSHSWAPALPSPLLLAVSIAKCAE